MKTAIVVAMALVGVSSLPIHAQQAGANTQQSVQANVGNRSVDESSSTSASASRNGVGVQGAGSASGMGQMSQVNGELVSKLDSKSAKVGDEVVVKTTEKATTAEGTVIPKGSRLIGHVTNVQAHGSGSEDSSLGIAFDRAELRGGQSMAIHSTIQSLAPAANMASSAAAGDDMDMSAPMGGASGGGGIRGGGAVRSGGGLVGGATGAVGSAVHSTGNTVGAASSGVASTEGQLVHTVGAAGRASGNAAAAAGNGVQGTASGTGSLAAHATAVPGVMLAGDASGATSGTLSAARHNVHLDSGTQVILGVSAASASSISRR